MRDQKVETDAVIEQIREVEICHEDAVRRDMRGMTEMIIGEITQEGEIRVVTDRNLEVDSQGEISPGIDIHPGIDTPPEADTHPGIVISNLISNLISNPISPISHITQPLVDHHPHRPHRHMAVDQEYAINHICTTHMPATLMDHTQLPLPPCSQAPPASNSMSWAIWTSTKEMHVLHSSIITPPHYH